MQKLLLLSLLLILTSSAYAKIVAVKDKVYLKNDGKEIPLLMVNDLVQKEEVKEVKLYGKGEVHIISFKRGKEKEKLYSVDEKGFIYALEPFANFEVSEVTSNGRIRFKQQPKNLYRVNSKGLFVN